ncbi:hypothetical protein AB0L74_10960 [Streptomyces sp. NPDC052020]|uniref:SCO2102 family sporulation regulator n=1 Tax=Streptomyces sp. NPDC052020 TaxID=3155677 RepID=UPI003416699D
MGWTVLYIAFGIVALWLLGEVLLQYKARLRWRLLAFAGFLGVVVGVLIPSVVVIALGAAAFAVGQTFVTLSFRRGFAAGWAVSAPGLARDRRRRAAQTRQEPALQVSGLEAAGAGHGDDDGTRVQDRVPYGHDDDYDRDDVFTPARPVAPAAAETTAVHQPQPLPDDTGSYGLYGDPGRDQAPPAPAGPAAAQPYAYGHSGYGEHGYGYDTAGGEQYAAYSDPHIGTHAYGGPAYDTGHTGRQSHAGQGYGQDPYATGGYGQTPPGGIWVPQQRTTDEPSGGELPPEQQPYPYHDGGQPQGQGLDEQYRY